jgi:hypothetical protein
MKVLNLLTEAVIVGISTVLMGLLVHYVFCYHAKHQNSPTMNQEMIDLSVTLFFTGFFLHLFFEVVGLNKYYINSHANSN